MILNRLIPLLLFAALGAHAQQTAPTPQTIEEALHQLSDAAGVIFTGEVSAIRHLNRDSGSSGVVEIDFRIDQAVRGCNAGSTYTLREWAGLWSGADERYRIGQRLLMLLHAAGPSGMSSPVGGMDGAIPIRGATTELAQQAAAANATQATASTIAMTTLTQTAIPVTPAAPVADLRWVGTRVMREIPYRAPTKPQSTMAAAKIAAPETSQSPDISDASTAAQQAPVSVVVNMLAAWQETSHAAQ
jgi:hypothetical protein